VRPRVAVAGGSLGGLSTALWLRDAGCNVEVYERSKTPLEGRGAGIVLNPATVRYVDRNGVHRAAD
jgi:2,6-dihydroxypyridine 3-monooxygenase